jgi:hypothetical protein
MLHCNSFNTENSYFTYYILKADSSTISEMLGVRFEAGFRYGHSQALGDKRVYPPTLVEIGLKIKPKG